MIVTRSALTVRCARCQREVRHFAAAWNPVTGVWTGTAFCHGDSAALSVPDHVGETTVFRPRGAYAHRKQAAGHAGASA